MAATLQTWVATTAPDLKAVNKTLQEALHRLADEEEDAAHLAAGARSAERVQQLLQRRHVRLGWQPCTKRVKMSRYIFENLSGSEFLDKVKNN
jgi:hypothetical protein